MADNIVRKQVTGEPGNGGEFGTHTRSEAPEAILESPPQRLRSDFIDASIANQEAAASYVARNAWARPEDFENELFDTWDTEAEYERDIQNPASEIMMLRESLRVENLPSGGVAVFWG